MIWKLAKILKNSIACLIPFFYTAFVIISLYTSTSCDSGLEESSFFKIQTFLTESYYAVWDFRPTQEFTAYLIFLTLAILLYILGGCRSPDNKAGEHFMRFQKFCSNNQEAIFLVTVTVVFCLSLNRLNLCEAVLGLMLMGYGLAICFASHALKIPILELYFMASLLLKVGHNTFSWHYIFRGVVCVLYLQLGCNDVSLIRFGEYCLQPEGKPENRNPSHGYGVQVFPFTGNTSYSLLGVTVDFP